MRNSQFKFSPKMHPSDDGWCKVNLFFCSPSEQTKTMELIIHKSLSECGLQNNRHRNVRRQNHFSSTHRSWMKLNFQHRHVLRISNYLGWYAGTKRTRKEHEFVLMSLIIHGTGPGPWEGQAFPKIFDFEPHRALNENAAASPVFDLGMIVS